MNTTHGAALQAKHALIDTQIHEEELRPLPDSVRLHDLKKQKLRLKEELSAQ